MDRTNHDPSFTLARHIDAPVEQVWDAWTDPDRIRLWWGPNGFTCSAAAVDFSIGGRTLVGMRMEQGPELFNTWTYTAIDEHRRIEFDSRFADGTGREVEPAEVGLPSEIPSKVPHVVTFKSLGEGCTELTVEEYGYEPGPLLEQSRLGQAQVLSNLAGLFEPA